jgi:hypothetical protein
MKIVTFRIQVCKYPEKTKSRKSRLSTEAYASARVVQAPRPAFDDEDAHRGGGRVSGGRTSLGEGDDELAPIVRRCSDGGGREKPPNKRVVPEGASSSGAKKAKPSRILPLTHGECVSRCAERGFF